MLIKLKSNSQYPHKRQKLDKRPHVDFLVGYKSINIYQRWIPHKQKVVSIQDVIFNENKVWDRKLIQQTPNEIKVIDEAIKVLQVPE